MNAEVPRRLVLAGLGAGALIPLVFFILGGWMLVETQRLVSVAQPVPAEVLRIDEDGRPVLGFAGPDGAMREARPHSAEAGWVPAPGSTADMLFDPATPQTLRRAGAWNLYGTASLFLLFGLVAELALFVALWRLVIRPARGG
jgi:hypothetical protein